MIDAMAYVACVAALVACAFAVKCFIDMKRVERGSHILSTLQRDLAHLHETRAEMYRAFIIERQTTGRPFTKGDDSKLNNIDTFGGAR